MKDEYAPKWAEYRRICKCGIYALVAFFAAPFVIIPILSLLLHFGMPQSLIHSNTIPFLIEAGLMITAMYFGWRQYTWECPRCGEPFGRLHEECQNCALPKWASEDETALLRDNVVSGGAS
jgi:hypothetical protein